MNQYKLGIECFVSEAYAYCYACNGSGTLLELRLLALLQELGIYRGMLLAQDYAGSKRRTPVVASSAAVMRLCVLKSSIAQIDFPCPLIGTRFNIFSTSPSHLFRKYCPSPLIKRPLAMFQCGCLSGNGVYRNTKSAHIPNAQTSLSCLYCLSEAISGAK